MTRASLIATLGTSPPVITEFLRYMIEAERAPVTDLTIIATQEREVLNGLELAKTAVKDRYNHVRIHEEILPFTDITSNNENEEFMKRMAQILAAQRRRYRAESIHLCLAGGRKDMSITTAILAQYLGVNSVYHIIMPNIKAFNAELERARKNIEELANAQDKQAYYNQHRELLEPLMYPPLHTYSIITIPLLPYPAHLLRETHQILKAEKTEPTKTRLPQDMLRAMQNAGLIKITTKGTIYPQEQGKRIQRILEAGGLF